MDEAAVVDATRDLAVVEVSAPMLSLIELGRDDEVYTWSIVAQHPLGRANPSLPAARRTASSRSARAPR